MLGWARGDGNTGKVLDRGLPFREHGVVMCAPFVSDVLLLT